MLTKLEAIEALQKEYHYSDILVEEEFIKQDDGTTVRNKLYDIADVFGIKLPITTFQPDPSQGKYSPLPIHTEECITNKHWKEEAPCACWGISYTGIAVMDVVNCIARLYDIYSSKNGRGFAQREKLEKLHELMSHMMEIPRETLEEMEHQANVIKITTGKTV